MNPEETTLGAVAESQQAIPTQTNTMPTGSAEDSAHLVETAAVTAESAPQEQNNATWTSSWVEQTTQAESTPAQTSVDDLLAQVNEIINENKTLETVAKEEDETQLQKENEAALDAIVKEQTKDLPSDSNTDVKTEATSNIEESDRLDEEIKQGLEDVKDKKSAEDMAKKVYLAFQKERSMHQFDNEQNANTIDVLKGMVKKLNEQVTSADNDPRVTKLDDEFYTLWRLEQAYKKDKSNTSKQNLKRYYVAKLATLEPTVSANKIMDMFNWVPLKSNVMGEAAPSSAPVVEKQPELKPTGLPVRKRGMF